MFDLTQEHLGNTEKCVMFIRNLLFCKVEDLDVGYFLPIQVAAFDFNQRNYLFGIPANAPWRYVMQSQEEFDRVKATKSGSGRRG